MSHRAPVVLPLLFAVLAAVAAAQDMKRPWLGVVLGVPVTPDFQPSPAPAPPYTGDVKRSLDFPFLAGGMIDVHIAGHFSIESDGLYRRLRYPNDPSVVVTREVPVLAKYAFSSGAVRPFAECGPSFRVTGNLNDANPSHYGVPAGAGADIRLKRLQIGPAIRYSHWAPDGTPIEYPPTITRQNQVELLAGIAF
jgi:hypothetical protein